MITTPTVFILGAGASAPYGFDTGTRLLDFARSLPQNQIIDTIKPIPPAAAPTLLDTLTHTLDSSIDAMLEPRPDITNAGKALMARLLLGQERFALSKKHVPIVGGDWYRTLFSALDAPDLDQALAQPVRFITYNYDRSLEFRLANAWRVRFCPDQLVNPAAIRHMFIHLHGQLGYLPEVGVDGPGNIVHYGGSEVGITDADVMNAAAAIQIIHEPKIDAPQFEAARIAISQAKRVIFLGFAFAKRNVDRLNLSTHLRTDAAVFATAMGFSGNQMSRIVKPVFANHPGQLIGEEKIDAYEFLRLYPQAID